MISESVKNKYYEENEKLIKIKNDSCIVAINAIHISEPLTQLTSNYMRQLC